jgi:hypothetical protein
MAENFEAGQDDRWVQHFKYVWLVYGVQYPARRYVCLHFTRRLTTTYARLEAKTVRYSFL